MPEVVGVPSSIRATGPPGEPDERRVFDPRERSRTSRGVRPLCHDTAINISEWRPPTRPRTLLGTRSLSLSRERFARKRRRRSRSRRDYAFLPNAARLFPVSVRFSEGSSRREERGRVRGSSESSFRHVRHRQRLALIESPAELSVARSIVISIARQDDAFERFPLPPSLPPSHPPLLAAERIVNRSEIDISRIKLRKELLASLPLS